MWMWRREGLELWVRSGTVAVEEVKGEDVGKGEFVSSSCWLLLDPCLLFCACCASWANLVLVLFLISLLFLS